MASQQRRTEQQAAQPSGQGHEVAAGEDLVRIAEQEYGNGAMWRDLMEANEDKVFDEGDIVLVGDTLDIVEIEDPDEPAEPPPSLQRATEPERVEIDEGSFLVVPDGYLGPLPPPPEDGVLVLRRSAFEEEVARRQAVLDGQRQAALEQVELFSEWQDRHATAGDYDLALEALAQLPPSQLAKALNELGGRVDEILDGVSDTARGSAAYGKVVVTKGPATIQARAKDLLNQGLVDGMLQEGAVQEIAVMLTHLPPDVGAAVFGSLPPSAQRFVVTHMPRGASQTDAQKQLLELLWPRTRDSDMAMLELLFATRFDVEVGALSHTLSGNLFGAIEPTNWEPAGLRRCWDVLLALPEGHVSANDFLDEWQRFQPKDPNRPVWQGGVYFGAHDAVALQYDAAKIQVDANNPDDPTAYATRLDAVVRHEVGHAVDDKVGGSLRHLGDEAWGGWQVHKDTTAPIVAAFLEDSFARELLSPEQLEEFRAALQTYVDKGKPSGVEDALAAMPCWSSLDPTTQESLASDLSVQAATHAMSDPWRGSQRHSFQGRSYQLSYGGYWTSFSTSALGRAVSPYQFRAPQEWFAEAYTAYYAPVGDGQDLGGKLATMDPKTKSWFDHHVHAAGWGQEF